MSTEGRVAGASTGAQPAEIVLLDERRGCCAPGLCGTVTLTGIRGTGYHGVFDHERREGQEFVVDVTMYPHPDVLAAAAASDDISAAIDYSKVAASVYSHIVGEPVNLIEALADRIAADIAVDDRISCVRVTVHKPQAPLPMTFADVSVTVCRGC